jgi:hypothetical protein
MERNPKKTRRTGTIFFLLAMAAFSLCASCSADISGSVEKDSSGRLFLKAEIEPATGNLIRSFAALGLPAQTGGKPRAVILNGAAISKSLAASPGIKSAALKNFSPQGIDGDIAVGAIGELLAAKNQAAARFATFESSDAGGRLAFHLERAAGPALLKLISPDLGEYLSALMAPVATGEYLGKSDYLELVASIYGDAVAKEIQAAVIAVHLTVPGKVASAKTPPSGSASYAGNRVNFAAPLLDALVLENPLDYEVRW